MALIVEDEVTVEVPWPDRGTPVPGVAVIDVLHVLLELTNHRLIVPPVGADLVVA